MARLCARAAGYGLVLALSAWMTAPAGAKSWQVDTAKSRIEFVGSQSGEAFRGRFDKFTAAIDFDPAKPEAGHAKIEIDMASAHTGEPSRDESMPQGDWFDTARFPKAVYEVKRFVAKGGEAYEAQGTLTIRDKSQPVALPFTLSIADGNAHAKGKVDLMRNAFGVGQGENATEDNVLFKITVEVDILARAGPGT